MSKSTARRVIKIRRLAHAEGLALPTYQTADAAGMDLLAAVPDDAPMVLKRGARALVPTGLVFELPSGMEAQVRPRSGLAFKVGVTVLNAPGTIDADYRGEVSVILINLGDKPFRIQRGDRIAQMVLAPVTQARLIEARQLSQTKRGSGGFGSTGVAPAKSTKSGTKRKPVAPKARNLKSATQKVSKPKRSQPSKR
ncbi:MAG TPA: dUTP diphosphatase [Hyphomicrobium sp.]|nr:dUTP diphosphatase [Hyphomicrobium sp.]